VATRARELLLDHLAVAERGARGPAATAAREAIGTGTAADTALVTGIASHSIELDDTYERASLHPGVAVWPAVLAIASERGATLGEVLDAGTRGYDVMCGLGDRLDPGETYRRGFHPTGVVGPLAAAAAVARLLGLDEERERHAVAIATSMAGGLLAFLGDGAWTKPLHAGQAAANGIRAALLAEAGYTGPADAVEGRLGFLHAFGAMSPEPVALRPGEGLERTAVKHYSCCRYMHGCIDLLIALADEEELTAEDVAEVRCGVLSGGWDLVAEPKPIRGQVDAQFSMAFGAALALTERRATLDDFERAVELAASFQPLIDRVECFRSERLDAAYPQAWGAEVEITTRGGAKLARAEDHFLGSPARPASAEDLRAKAALLLGEQRASELAAACLEGAAREPMGSGFDPVEGSAAR
jgi:2-methylcitrate dehydratase PrpD